MIEAVVLRASSFRIARLFSDSSISTTSIVRDRFGAEKQDLPGKIPQDFIVIPQIRNRLDVWHWAILRFFFTLCHRVL